MSSGNESQPKRYGLFNGKGEMVFSGSYEACKAEWQRRHEDRKRLVHQENFNRQLRWRERGCRDDERGRC
jgi:hypothetical protein